MTAEEEIRAAKATEENSFIEASLIVRLTSDTIKYHASGAGAVLCRPERHNIGLVLLNGHAERADAALVFEAFCTLHKQKGGAEAPP